MRKPAAIILFLLAIPLVAGSEQTYSDVTYIEESGDQVGVEIRFTAGEDGAVSGVLLHYEGLDAAPVPMTGRLQGNALSLTGSIPEARVTVDARIIGQRLVGTLRYHLSRQTNEVELDLPRVKRSRVPKD